MIVLFTLMAFALLDTFVISKCELIDHQIATILLQPLAMLTLMVFYAEASYALYRYFKQGMVPARESRVLSGFLVVIFLLSLGPLGLWQLDHDKFDKPLIDFYEKLKK